MMAYMSFLLNAMSSSAASMGDEGFRRTVNTIGINTTHAAVRGT
jgi:hypothetical protein